MNMHSTVRCQFDNKANPDWWRGAVVYQIYPRSFQDSNGDGIGDLMGIVQRMPYIASLGVDAIWISPFFTSPMKDFGYDVSDYCDVDPMFGTLADFDAVVDAAHAAGVRVLIDLVLSHTSDQHPWFIESRSSRDNPKADWYVWSDPKADGTVPNNWLSIFGGSSWQWNAERQQYYLHNFLSSQPDLNFHCDEVQDAVLDVAQFWLNRGVDGFRLDTINFYVHDAQLRDNPPLPQEMRNATIAPQVNPYNHQEHIYDKNRPENLDFLRKLRAKLEPFGAAAVGEVGDAQKGLEIMGQYTAGDDLMHMCYAFEFLSNDRPTSSEIVTIMDRVDQVAADGWPCWAFSNHDTVRHATRWRLELNGLKLMTTLMMCLRGSACIYQGEELGFGESDVAYEDLQDPYGIEFWPEFKGRDGCRTPMVWELSNQNGGFSEGRPWLPISSVHQMHCVTRQEEEPGALLHHYRKAIAFRRAHPALRIGATDKVRASGDVIYFQRISAEERLLCVFNMSDTPSDFELPGGEWTPIGEELGTAHVSVDGKLHLGPWQVCLAQAQ